MNIGVNSIMPDEYRGKKLRFTFGALVSSRGPRPQPKVFFFNDKIINAT